MPCAGAASLHAAPHPPRPERRAATDQGHRCAGASVGAGSVNDCFRPVSRYFDRIQRPEQLLSALPRALRVMTDPAECGPVTLAFCQDVQAEAWGQRRAVQLGHEGLARRGKLRPQAAARPQDACAAVGAETFHDGELALQMAHHLPQRDLMRRAHQPQPAGPAALGPHEAAKPQVADHLGQVMLRDGELPGDLPGRDRLFRRPRQPHQHPQSVVGKGRKTHRLS